MSDDLVVARRDHVLAAMTKGRDLLVRARADRDVRLAKQVSDQAAAIERLAKRQTLGEEWIGLGHSVKIEALALIGDLLAAMPKASGTRGQLTGRGVIGGRKNSANSPAPPSYAALGIDKATAAAALELEALPVAAVKAIAAGTMTIAEARRERKAIEVRRAIALPNAKYRILYADPPWAYNDKADAGAVQAGGAARHYPTMTIAELCAMEIPAIVADDAVLFLWVTSPLLFESAPVIAAWGFTYRASFVWDKIKHNMGHYNSVRHEFLLVCTRGRCTPDHLQLFDSVQAIERGAHSVKPEAFREIIQTLYPRGKRIELFARARVAGWHAFGFEAD